VGPRAVMDECGKSRPHQDSTPGPYSPEQSAIPAGVSPPPPEPMGTVGILAGVKATPGRETVPSIPLTAKVTNT